MHLTAAVREVVASADHRPFVLDSFSRSLASLGAIPSEHVREHVTMLDCLMRGLGRVIVATHASDPQTFLGWAAEADGALVFAYVPHRLRRLGIAKQMFSCLFNGGPIRLVYWTDAAQRMQDAGFPIVHAWDEFTRRERKVNRRVHSLTVLSERTV